MELSGLGITLRRLRREDIELVRQHRNSPEIQKRMEFRDEITREQQEKWFASIDNDNNFYFLIDWHGEAVGMIYGSKMDWNLRETGNGGIFIWEQSVLETNVPMLAALLLSDFSFIINLRRIHAYILSDNARAIAFNTGLGYQLQPGQESLYKQHYILTKHTFEDKAGKLLRILTRKHGDVYTLKLKNLSDPAEKRFADVISGLPEMQKKRLNVLY